MNHIDDESPDEIDHEVQNHQRAAYLEKRVLPAVAALFKEYRWLQSAMMLLAQYWDDEAADAVQCRIVPSRLERPNLEAYFGVAWDEHDAVTQPENDAIPFERLWKLTNSWDANHSAIPLFACFCAEGGNQLRSERENYRPYALFRRSENGEVAVEIVGTMLRPWLDGVAAQWDDHDDW